jgi:hypothetical protein
MAVGGLVGWLRRSTVVLAKGVAPEPSSVLTKLVLMPTLAAVALWTVYLVYFMPWAGSMLESQ